MLRSPFAFAGAFVAAVVLVAVGTYNVYAAVGVIVLIIAGGLALRGQLGFALTLGAVASCCCSGIAVGSLITLTDIFLLPAAALAFTRLFSPNRPPALPWWGVFPVLTCLVMGLVGGLVVHPETLRYMFQFTGFFFLVPFTVGVYADSKRRLRALAGAYLFSASVNALIAGTDALRLTNIGPKFTNFQGFDHTGRVEGLTGNTNQLGLLSVMAIPFALYFASRHRAFAITVPILVLGVFASGSRGALLGLPLVLILHAVIYGKQVARRLIVAGVVTGVMLMGALVVGLTVGLSRFFSSSASGVQSTDARVERLSYAISQIAQYPLTGVGYGLGRAHNVYVELTRSGGLVTGFAWLAFVIGATVAGLRLRKEFAVIVAAVTAQSAWFVLALQHNGLYERFLFVPTGLITGAVIIETRRRKREARERLLTPVVTERSLAKSRSAGAAVKVPAAA